MATLFLVATPIGNLKDITLRAMGILTAVNYITCEDTRKTGFLLKRLHLDQGVTLQTKPKLISYYEQNELQRIPEIISLLKAGNDVALVSDGGTPTISDPGFKLVRECLKEGIKVESIPGPSAVISALVTSGLPTDKFLFLGFLPKKEGHRLKLLKNYTLNPLPCTLIFFEAPHRLVKTLGELKEVFGDVEIVVCRELTKIHEEIRREKLSESLKHFEWAKPKGEFVILLNSQKFSKVTPCVKV